MKKYITRKEIAEDTGLSLTTINKLLIFFEDWHRERWSKENGEYEHVVCRPSRGKVFIEAQLFWHWFKTRDLEDHHLVGAGS